MSVLLNMKHGLLRPVKSEVGFSTLEILIASTIALSIFSASAMVVYSAQDLALSSELKNGALQIIREKLSLAEANNDPALFLSSPEQRGEYLITTENKPLSRFADEWLIKVSWTERDRVREESASLTKTIYNSDQSADTCTLYWSGIWTTPLIKNIWQLPNNALITDIDVLGGLAVITTDDNTQALPDFYVYNVKDPLNPQLLGSLNTGPGLSALQVVNSLVYVANTSVSSQLQIIDITQPANPQLVSSLALPNASFAGIHGHSIYVNKHKVYLGTQKNLNQEFYIIDVINPSAPQTLGAFETDTQVNTIIVDQGKAFLATPNQAQLRVLDVESPASIQEVGSFSSSGYQVQDGRSLDLFGDRVFLGRTVGGFNNPSNHELFNLNFSNSNQLTQNFSVDLAASVRSLFARDNFIFIGTNDPAKEWQVWAMGSANALIFWSALDLPASVVSADCEEQLFYAGLEGNSKVVIIGSN